MKFGKTRIRGCHFQSDPAGEILVQILAYSQKFFLILMSFLAASYSAWIFTGKNLHLKSRRPEKQGIKLK